jgi:hypothetical protein
VGFKHTLIKSNWLKVSNINHLTIETNDYLFTTPALYAGVSYNRRVPGAGEVLEIKHGK